MSGRSLIEWTNATWNPVREKEAAIPAPERSTQ